MDEEGYDRPDSIDPALPSSQWPLLVESTTQQVWWFERLPLCTGADALTNVVKLQVHTLTTES